MARYFLQKTDNYDYWREEGLVLKDISVPEHIPTDTGLINSDGDKIMRSPNPIGFIWND